MLITIIKPPMSNTRRNETGSFQQQKTLRSILPSKRTVITRSHSSSSRSSCILLMNRRDFLPLRDGQSNRHKRHGKQKPIDNGECKSSVDGVTFSDVGVSTVGSDTLLVFA